MLKRRLLSLAGVVALAASSAHAQDAVDTSQIFVKKAIADTMTPEQLQAYKERLARARAAGAFDRAPGGPIGLTPGDICSAATHEMGSLPYGPVADTTVGATDNYDLPPDIAAPTCTASSNCTGAGPPGSLPRGGIYNGTGTGADRAFKIRTDQNCDVTITMQPTGGDDLALIVYQTNCSSNLSDCVCVSDTGFGGQSESVTLSAVATPTFIDYFVVVDGYSAGGTPPGPAGPYTLTITQSSGICNLVPVELQSITIE